MYFVYLVPLFLVVLVALAIFAPPLAAVLFFLAFVIGFGAFKFFGPGPEPEHVESGEAAAAGKPARSRREDTEGGIWGERWPEQRGGEEPS